MKALRVLLVHNRYQQRGGEDVVFDREKVLLVESGVEVDSLIFTNDEIQTMGDKLDVALHAAYSLRSKEAVAERIRQFRPDLVHVHNTFPLVTPSVFDACREAGVPTVKTLHNYRLVCANGLLLREGKPCTLCEDQRPWRSVRYGCYRDSMIATIPVARAIDYHWRTRTWENSVNLFICMTEFAKGFFSRAGLPANKIYVKSNSCPDVRRVLGVSANSSGRGVFFLGRLAEEKGLRTLANAWSGGAFPLRVLGDGPLGEWLRARGMPVESGLSQVEAWRAMSSGRCLVVPTECFEGAVPLVIIEALSLGLPVVATRMGGIPEVLRHEENALLVDAGDAAALRGAIQRILADDMLWQKLSSASRKLYESHFAEQVGVSNLLACYRKLLAV